MAHRTGTTTRPTDPAAKARVASLNEPTAQPPTNGAMAKAEPGSNGRSRTDMAFGDLIDIVKHAERQVYDGQTAVSLQAELDNARRQMQRREHVDPQVIQAIYTIADGWMLQAGLRDEGGGS
jgi:hypothetical protein